MSIEGRTFELSEKEDDLLNDGLTENINKIDNGNNSMNGDEGNNNNSIKRIKSM